MSTRQPSSPNKVSPEEVNALRSRMTSVDLGPGEMHATETPTLISTVLGSCVSVCLYSPARKIGAMCHCVLPTQPRSPGRRYGPNCCVDTCVGNMIEAMTRQHKVPFATIRAKLFGGAEVLQTGAAQAGETATIGKRNIAAARQALREYALPLVAECVGGAQGYRILFNTETGEVLLRRAQNSRIDEHDLATEFR